MTIFNVLTMIGGMSLFLFGMHVMSEALERSAGGNLKNLLGKMTTNKATGFLTGAGVTAVIQSSSATTVMVVGFVNSGLMELRQAVNVIMGANVGTTITSWILSLSGIDGKSIFIQLLKPTSFSPILALIGVGLMMFSKSNKKKTVSTVLLGFSTLMFGMETMSSAVSVLKNVPEFTNLFVAFKNPVLGVLAGMVLTAIIQSSSASVGILQALAVTGSVSFGAAIPIIMGQNIGTCVTAIISSIGANKNAKRSAFVHLSFNIIGAAVLLTVYCVVKAIVPLPILNESATMYGIAVVHTVFNVLCTVILLPMGGILEKLACKIIPDSNKQERTVTLDERLLVTPRLALERCRMLVLTMANYSVTALKNSVDCVEEYSEEKAKIVREAEEKTDEYEDMISSYAIKLSARQTSEKVSMEITEILKLIGDYERIADHSLNILESAEEMKEKKIVFSDVAKTELTTIILAVKEILSLSVKSYESEDLSTAQKIEPLEQVIDKLRDILRESHILRLQQGKCTETAGFIWEDLLINLERIADHCSNIGGCVIDKKSGNLNLHDSLRKTRKNDSLFKTTFEDYQKKYAVKY